MKPAQNLLFVRVPLGILWFPLVAGLLILQIFLAPQQHTFSVQLGAELFISLSVLLAVIGIRWLALPRSKKLPHAILWFVSGMVLAQALGIYAVFQIAGYGRELVWLIIVAQLMYLPIFRLPVEAAAEPPEL